MTKEKFMEMCELAWNSASEHNPSMACLSVFTDYAVVSATEGDITPENLTDAHKALLMTIID
jgi:hypothetical protein